MRSARIHALLQLPFPLLYVWYVSSTALAAQPGWWPGLVFLGTQVVWAGGVFGALAMPNWRPALWMLLVGAMGPLAVGTIFHVLRITHILKTGHMEAADGMGSPAAFVLGWAFTTVLVFLPGLAFTLVNGMRLWALRHGRSIAT